MQFHLPGSAGIWNRQSRDRHFISCTSFQAVGGIRLAVACSRAEANGIRLFGREIDLLEDAW